MVQIILDIPKEPNPDLAVPLRFVQGCVNNDASVANLSTEAFANCRRLREAHPGDPLYLHLSGILAMILSNPEGAACYWAEALIASPGYRGAAAALSDVIEEHQGWAHADDLVGILAQGPEHLIRHYAENARAAFDAGDLDEADKWAQRISAANQRDITKLHEIAVCRNETAKLRAEGHLEVVIDKIFANYQRYWGGVDEAGVRDSVNAYKDVPDRQQLADIVRRLVERDDREDPVIMEFGCYAGFNLQNTFRQLTDAHKARTTMIGIEPNALACRIGAEISPDVTFVRGDHRELAAGVLDLPERVDICIISRVLMILKPDDVAEVLQSLAGRVRTLVICDDIFNTDGDGPVIRMPPEFIILHPFRQLLADAEFVVSELIMADVPDRECTGFIVATATTTSP